MARSADDIRAAILRILREQLGVSAEILAGADDATRLLGRGIGIDSFETLALVAGLEQAFSIQIDDAELTAETFSTLGNVAVLVRDKLDQPGGPAA